MQVHEQQRRRSVHKNLSDSFRMLNYASPCDIHEIDSVHSKIINSCNKLSALENQYKIKNYMESRNPESYPYIIRSVVIRLWADIDSGAIDLDFLFIDEDLYPLPYF